MNKYTSILIIVFFSVFNIFEASATHIVGGGITYRCLGPDGSGRDRYEIKVEIYQDCLNGLDIAINEDNPAYIGIFSNDGQVSIRDSIGRRANGDTVANFVPPNFSNECVNNPPTLCLRRLEFKNIYSLPRNSSGYKIVYIRCCRNESIVNIINPGQVGATYFTDIPPSNEVQCNTSARFNNYPPQIICINTPLYYDHSAFDADGDSISYELCEAYPGGTANVPKPTPTPFLPPPISQPNNNPPSFGYSSGFSPAQPMGGNPLIQINPETGIITGTPNLQGRFVVSVCAHEWRDGSKINTVRREFQFTVTNCSKKVVAGIPQFSDEYNTYIVECESKTVDFVNTSSGGFKYDWDFGIPGATSTDFEPTYTYPDTGVYEVKLIVNKGTTCQDSIKRFVKIYPEFTSDFNFDGLKCPNAEINFLDQSFATFGPVTKWSWDFGDGNTSQAENPSHRFARGGQYNIQLISTSIKGCTDTTSQVIDIDKFRPFVGNDTIIVQGESVFFNATGGVDYEWTPGTNLNATNISNPIGYYPDTGVYSYDVRIKSPAGCEGNDSISVWVVGQGSLFVPSAFTPNGDGLNDYVRPLTVGYSSIEYFRIFNRWGQLVYESTSISDGGGWDGTFNSQKCDIGTYYWLLSATDKDGADVFRKGDVTLIR